MADEEAFKELMEVSRAFNIVKSPRFLVRDPRDYRNFVEIDNIGQKSKTLFIFEGSKGKPDLGQLHFRFFLFAQSNTKSKLIEDRILLPYENIRVFFYNLSSHRLIEFDKHKNVTQTLSYNDRTQLIAILRNL